MNAVQVITAMGAAVSMAGERVKLSGLDKLPDDVAAGVVAVAKAHRDDLLRELGASAPGSGQDGTGLDWLPESPGPEHPDFDSWWACSDLADLCRLHSLRVVRSGKRRLILYPATLPDGLIQYAASLHADGRPYLIRFADRLPILTPAQAVAAIKRIMAVHAGLRCTPGTDGSLWPVYPASWTANQKAALEALWFAAGEALDRDDFREAEPVSVEPIPKRKGG